MAFDGKEFRGPNGVNVAFCLSLAEVVEASPTFDMAVVHKCKTPACIAGHALAMIGAPLGGSGFTLSGRAERSLQKALGITEDQVGELFSPTEDMRVIFYHKPGQFGHITNAHAAACLRNLTLTGEVDWLGTKPKGDA